MQEQWVLYYKFPNFDSYFGVKNFLLMVDTQSTVMVQFDSREVRGFFLLPLKYAFSGEKYGGARK